MTRVDKFLQFIEKYANTNFNIQNINRILENLEKAVNDNKLYDFFLNKKPYRSAFPVITSSGGARGKDQCSIVFALNIYGADHPGFVPELYKMLKKLATGSQKEARSVMVLMLTQMELQELEISLINFVDADLLNIVNNSIRKHKKTILILCSILVVACSIGAPGFAMIGLAFPLSLLCAAGIIYSYIKIVNWIGIKRFKDELIKVTARPVAEYSELETEGTSANIQSKIPADNSEGSDYQSTHPTLSPNMRSDSHSDSSDNTQASPEYCDECGTKTDPRGSYCAECGDKLK